MVTFDFYKDTWRGNLDEDTFEKMLPGAVATMNQITFHRIPPDDDRVDIKMGVCELIDFNKKYQDTEADFVLLESDGVTHRHYREKFQPDQERQRLVEKWLAAYPELTFRGF